MQKIKTEILGEDQDQEQDQPNQTRREGARKKKPPGPRDLDRRSEKLGGEKAVARSRSRSRAATTEIWTPPSSKRSRSATVTSLGVMMELLSHDVVEHILERLPAKSLVRFKRVSKLWKSTIESKSFQERQLIHRQQYSRDVLRFFARYDDDDDDYIESISSSSSVVTLVKLPIRKSFVCSNSCDGLIWLYHEHESNIVINPTTRWHRTLPLSNFQQRSYTDHGLSYMLGFGKDKFNGAYKGVWLYKSLDNSNTTTCEVFDFSTNAWRYITHGCPYEIIDDELVYIDGLFYWLTKCEETKVLSFDLHTESFEVIAKAPFVRMILNKTTICNLNERLCISEDKWPNHVIWLFDSDSKTWSVMYSITDLYTSSYPCSRGTGKLFPLAVLDKDKLLFCHRSGQKLVIYDCQTKSCESAFPYISYVWPLCYFQTLISIP